MMQWTIRGLLAGALVFGASMLEAQQPQQPPQPQQPQPRQPQAFPQAPQQSPPQPKQDVVAMVNGDPITKKQLQVTVQTNLQGRQVDPETAEKFKKQTLNNLIEGLLIEQHVAEKGPEVKSEEVDSVVTRVKQQLQAQDVQFDQYLTSRGHTEQSFKKRIKGSLGWQKYQQDKMKPENLREFFEDNRNKFQAEEFEEARQEVAQLYVASLWEGIVSQQKPKAEIKIVNDDAPKPPQQQPPQRQQPQQQQSPNPNAFPR